MPHPNRAGQWPPEGVDVVMFGRNTRTTQVEILRLVLDGPPKPDSAEQILSDAVDRWPARTTARFMVLPGGFAETSLPESWDGQKGWNTRPEDLEALIPVAQRRLHEILTPAMKNRLQSRTRYISLGIDVLTDAGMKGPHAELVVLFDVQKNRVVGWTGKSFPTSSQENRLIRATDLESHFMHADGLNVVVLGCNDLNLYSPRVMANTVKGSRRRKLVEAMIRRTERFEPDVILQHPHATDTPNIWRGTWCAVERLFPKLTDWASAIRYFNPANAPRQPLRKVLEQTRNEAGTVQDLVIKTDGYPSRPSRYMGDARNF